jgi:hypothetical protein
LFQEKLEFIPVFLCKLESRKSLSRKGKVRIECKNSRIPVFSENGWLDQQLCKEEALRASATPHKAKQVMGQIPAHQKPLDTSSHSALLKKRA